MVDTPKPDELPLLTRISLLEAKVRLLSIVMKWLVGGIVTTLIAYLLNLK